MYYTCVISFLLFLSHHLWKSRFYHELYILNWHDIPVLSVDQARLKYLKKKILKKVARYFNILINLKLYLLTQFSCRQSRGNHNRRLLLLNNITIIVLYINSKWFYTIIVLYIIMKYETKDYIYICCNTHI